MLMNVVPLNSTKLKPNCATILRIENRALKILVEQTGFEPISSELQSAALTNFATVPKRVSIGNRTQTKSTTNSRANRYTIDTVLASPIGFEPILLGP